MRALLVTFLVATVLLVPLPGAGATHVPGFSWDWCIDGRCLPDRGSLYIEADTDEGSGYARYYVGFSGALGAAGCSGQRDSGSAPLAVSGVIVFPHEVSGEIVTTTIACADIYASVGRLVIDGLLEFPLCGHSGRVEGQSPLLGTIVGQGGYWTFC